MSELGERRLTRGAKWWVVVAVACVFGPYLVSGLRTEQLAMYGSAVWIGTTQVKRLPRVLRPGAVVLALWSGYAAIALVGAAVTTNETSWETGSLPAGLDNAILPLATIVTALFWATLAPRAALLRLAAWTVIVAMSANAVLAIYTTYAGLEAVPGLARFWAADGTDVFVALLAEQMGRFSGVFNQPAEAGVAYSLAAFCVVYVVRSEKSRPGATILLPWALILIGGMLTLSKVFVVGGLAVLAVVVLVQRAGRVRLAVSAAAAMLGMAVLGSVGLAGSWGAAIMFNWYRVSVLAGDSWIYTLSAGRFGTAGTEGGVPSISPPITTSTSGSAATDVTQTTATITHAVMADHPWFGVGARGLQVAYDSAWTEAVIVCGLVGVVLVVLVHLYFPLRWLRLYATTSRPERVLSAAVVILTLGSAFGLPSLTANRESTLLWIFLGLLILSRGGEPAGRFRLPQTWRGRRNRTAADPLDTRDRGTVVSPAERPGA